MEHSFKLKLLGAKEHLDCLKVESQTWLESRPYEIVDESDPSPLPHYALKHLTPVSRRFRMNRLVPIPDRLRLLIGDCIFNLRACLDHLVLAIARASTPKMTAVQIAGCEFPIFSDRAMLPNEEARKMGCVGPDARTIIKALQPYNRGDGYRSDPLWQIQELNRIDKQDSLPIGLVASMIDGKPGFGFVPPQIENNIACFLTSRFSSDIEVKENAVIFQYVALPKDPQLEVYLQSVLTPELAFRIGGPAEREGVIPTLNALCDFVSQTVITMLCPFL